MPAYERPGRNEREREQHSGISGESLHLGSGNLNRTGQQSTVRPTDRSTDRFFSFFAARPKEKKCKTSRDPALPSDTDFAGALVHEGGLA